MGSVSTYAVITGASGGLGQVLVEEFSSADWFVIGIGRSDAPRDFPDNAEYRSFDAADLRNCQNFWSEVHEMLPSAGTADLCLINNAGMYVRNRLLDTAPEAFEASIRANYLTAAHMTRAMVDLFEAATIINIVTTSAQQAKITNSAYGSAKAGMAQFFRSMQQEFSPSRYRVTNLYPGALRTHGEGSEIAAIEPRDLSQFIRDIVEIRSSFYLSEATILPSE